MLQFPYYIIPKSRRSATLLRKIKIAIVSQAIVLLESIATSFYVDTFPLTSCSELKQTNSCLVSKKVIISLSGRQMGLLTLRPGHREFHCPQCCYPLQTPANSRDDYDIFGECIKNRKGLKTKQWNSLNKHE